MKFRLVFLLIAVLCFPLQKAAAQCFEIQQILVDACGTPEGENEMLRIKVGNAPLVASSMTATWPTNNYLGICMNAQTAASVAALNASIQACGYILEPLNDTIPANATLLVVTSTNMNPAFNAFTFLSDTIYMIFQCPGNTIGHFRNWVAGGGAKKTVINFGNCTDSVTYYNDSLVTPAGVNAAQDGATVYFTNAGATDYQNNGCNAPIPSLSANITPSNPTPCQGSTILLTASFNSNNFISWFWIPGVGTIQNPASLNTNYVLPIGYTGSDVIKIAIVTSCQDTLYDSIQVTVVNQTASVSISAPSPASICPGDSVLLSASGTGSFLWSTGDTTASIYAKAAGNYTVTVNNSCATASASVNVTMKALTTAAITPSSPLLCQGSSINLVASGGGTYLWSTGATTAAISVTTAGTYAVTVSGACNSVTANYTATVTTPIPAQITALSDTTFCPGDSVILQANAGGTYLWSTGSTASSITIKQGGIYTLTVSSVCGSNSTHTTINILPETIGQWQATGKTILCAGDSVQLTASGGTSYLWSTGSTSNSVTCYQSGNYSVTINGVCGTDVLDTTIQYTSYPTAFVSVLGDTSLCPGDSVVLVATGNGIYSWSTGSSDSSIKVSNIQTYVLTSSTACGQAVDSIAITALPKPIIQLTAGEPLSICLGDSTWLSASGNGHLTWSTGDTTSRITVHDAGIYTATITNQCGTVQADTSVMIRPLPMAQISGTGNRICPGTALDLIATGGNEYTWSNGSTDSHISIQDAGVYTVIVQNDCGTDTASFEILPSLISAYFTPSTHLGDYPLPVIFTDQSTHAISWTWSMGDTKSAWVQHPQHTYQQPGTYAVTLTVQDSLGCEDSYTDTIVVTDYQSVYVPLAFTPNGDQSNDYFDLKGYGIASFTAMVFDRWGHLVHSWTQHSDAWDGKFKGKDAPLDTYVWVIDVLFDNGRTRSLKGKVSLIR